MLKLSVFLTAVLAGIGDVTLLTLEADCKAFTPLEYAVGGFAAFVFLFLVFGSVIVLPAFLAESRN